MWQLKDMSESPSYVEIPLERFSEDILRKIIEEFIGREGTDYGTREVTWESKIQDVRRQLERGDARVVFDPATETTNILTADELSKRAARARARK